MKETSIARWFRISAINKRNLCFLFGFLLLTSCTSTVSRKELDTIIQQKIPIGNTIHGKAYYTGCDETWHYYYLELPFTWDRRYKIAKRDDIIEYAFPYTSDRMKWLVIYPVHPSFPDLFFYYNGILHWQQNYLSPFSHLEPIHQKENP